jgi:ABC-type iron transport system FetAB ATPase subunit
MPQAHGWSSYFDCKLWLSHPKQPDFHKGMKACVLIDPFTHYALCAGKSTMIAFTLRFYDPTKGDVLLDGKNLKDVNVHSLRDHIA